MNTGPYEGTLGDWLMFQLSRFPERVQRNLRLPDGREPLVYGDPAYFLGRGIMGAYRHQRDRNMTEEELRFNRYMANQRITIEWGFGKTLMQWKFISTKYNLKLGLSPIGSYYAVCILLSNIHTCFWGSATAVKFDCPPPTLQEYLHSVR